MIAKILPYLAVFCGSLLATLLLLFASEVIGKLEKKRFATTTNVDMFMGPTYNYDGWIELYNPTDTTILLRNGFISRSPSQPKQCPLPWSLRIKPHAYGIIWMGEHEDKAVG